MMAIKQELEDQYSILDIGLDWINLLLEKREFFELKKKQRFLESIFSKEVFSEKSILFFRSMPRQILFEYWHLDSRSYYKTRI